MKIFRIAYALLFILYAAKISGQNQQIFLSEKMQNGQNKITFAKLDPQRPVASSEVNDKSLLRQLTVHSDNITYRLERAYKGSLDFTHKVYKAYFRGIEVTGGLDYVVHVRNGDIIMANGDFSDIDYVNEKPVLSGEEAAAKAKEWNLQLKIHSEKLITGTPEFVICKDLLKEKDQYKAAYKLLLKTGNPVEDGYIYVDAINGNIIRVSPLVCTGNAPGTAQTRYSGTKGFTTDFTGSQYRLRQVRNGVNIVTLNNNYSNDESGASATDFWDNNNVWTAAEHGVNQPATDAHWGTEKVFDYWLTQHNRNSIDNAGMSIVSYVHFRNSYDNAFWHQNNLKMYYGDGGSSYRPLTSLDVCAHEIGHGICQFTSNLSHALGTESSALNEGFSDIWGACIEAWAAPNKQKWLIGEEITLLSPGHLRSMNNPNNGAYQPSPDTYNGQYWNDDPDAHFRNGVLNKWFYILTEGETGTNDLGNNYSVAGIGIINAARIAYLTEQLLNSTANYAAARTMSIQSATQLFGSTSCEAIAVTRAWYAVGVGANYSGPIPQLSITGSDVLCSQETYSISLPAGASVVWGNGGSWFTVAPNGASAVVTSSGQSGQAHLGATVSGLTGCYAQSNPNIEKLLRLGAPTQYTLIPYYSTTGYSYYLQENNCLKTYTFPGFYSGNISLEDQTATSFNWNFVSKYPSTAIAGISYSDPRYATVTVKPQYAWAIYRLTTSNICGSYSHDYKFVANGRCIKDVQPQWVQINNGLPTITILPNPVTSNFTITLTQGMKYSVIREVVILNKIGLVMKRVHFNNQSDKQFVDISLLPSDVYIVKVFDGSEWVSGKIIKQ